MEEKAKLYIDKRIDQSDGSILEMVIWKLPVPTILRPHGYKYRLNYSLPDGSTLVRYDNKAGKKDHKHIKDREYPYNFTTPEQAIIDFLNDVNKEWRTHMTKQNRKKEINVTIRSTASVINEVLDTCRKLQQGLPVAEAQTELTFNDAATMLSTLSAKRLELLTFLHKHGAVTIKELSRQLNRNYSNVHEDVQLLLRLGLLDKDDAGKIYVSWDELNISFPLAA